jgi:hypothetical protein
MTASNAARGSEEEISARAYEIWESEGRPEGRDKEHWFRARELATEASPDEGAEAGEAPAHTHVRPAGRKKMAMPPETWSKTDEEADESFPASDPPGNY